MAEAADAEGVCGELRFGNSVRVHRHEAESDDWDHPVAQRLSWPARILLRQDLDQVSRQIWHSQPALY